VNEGETRWGPMDRSVGMLGLLSGALFLMSYDHVAIHDCMRYVWSRAIRGSTVESMWCVDQVSPIGCTLIRIIVTLEYE
jgi:hypothetical protein